MRRNLLTLLLFAFVTAHAAAQVPDFGLPAPKTYTVLASEFVPASNDVIMKSAVLSRYPEFPLGNSGSIYAPVHLPDGTRVIGYELQYCRSEASPGIIMGGLDERCETESECYIAPTGLGVDTTVTGDQVGCFRSLVWDGRPAVDNMRKLYYADLQFTAKDGAMSIMAFRVYYRNATPPRPVSPTFSDVPASDPGFPFIEALHAAGLTAGCGGGKFCPDGPVTRRQMAVFLAGAVPLPYAEASTSAE